MLNSGDDLHESIHVCNLRVSVKLIRGSDGKTGNSKQHHAGAIIRKCGAYFTDVFSMTFITG
ncbi:hypothetical protein DOA20_24560 [Salmonella enterica subsp. enterica serovar Newport]|nr:hypothetical protein [Salmonella enterica subsp. enterica serovar Newport]